MNVLFAPSMKMQPVSTATFALPPVASEKRAYGFGR